MLTFEHDDRIVDIELSTEEAFRLLDDDNTSFAGRMILDPKTWKAFEMARDALAKANPEPVEYLADGYSDGQLVYDMASCPRCGHDYEYGCANWEDPFCPECGQALDWGENVNEPEKGKWIKPIREKAYERICSLCKKKCWYIGEGNYDYCPNCGHPMEKKTYRSPAVDIHGHD